LEGSATGENFVEAKPIFDLTGSWSVQFDAKWGGPNEPVVFEKLQDWTQRSEPGIKYYSGKASYRKIVDVPHLPTDVRQRKPKVKIYLDLGTVKNLAEVRLNGKSLGTVWCAPWRVEVTGIVKAKGNELEIDIVNLWPNRMIGDEQLPDDCQWQSSGFGGMQLKALPQWLLENKPRRVVGTLSAPGNISPRAISCCHRVCWDRCG